MDGLVAVCAAVLFVFPVAVVWLASRQPVVPEAQGALAPIDEPGPAPRLRDLPVLTGAHGARDRDRPFAAAALRTAVDEHIERLFDAREAARLRRYLRGPPIRPPSGAVTPFGEAAYPYRYAGLDGLLDAALPGSPQRGDAAAQNGLAALLVLAEDAGVFPNAGQVAYAILHRARAGGGCDAQLNLAFLLAVSARARFEDAERELAPGRTQPARPTPPRRGCAASGYPYRTGTRAPRRSRGRSRCSHACSGASRDRPPAGRAGRTRCCGWLTSPRRTTGRSPLAAASRGRWRSIAARGRLIAPPSWRQARRERWRDCAATQRRGGSRRGRCEPQDNRLRSRLASSSTSSARGDSPPPHRRPRGWPPARASRAAAR